MRAKLIYGWVILALVVMGTAPGATAQSVSSNTLYFPTIIRWNNPAYVSPFAVSMYDEISDARGLSAMASAGARYAMTNARWVDIEPIEGGAYDFSSVDVKVQALTSKGIRPVLIFDHNPAWAMTPPSTLSDPIRWPVAESKLPRLVAVVRALAQRYNGQNGLPRVDYWGLYGDPDNRGAWGFVGTLNPCPPGLSSCTVDHPAAYADMLALVAPEIRAANGSARILNGGLAFENSFPNVFNYQFIDRVLARLATKPGGVSAYLDAIGFNFIPRIGSNPTFATIGDKAAVLRQRLATAGVPNLPLIALEMGVWSGSGGNLPPYPMDETRQAQFVAQEFVRGLAAGVIQMHYFQPLDSPNYFNWGLFRGQDVNDPKPAYSSYTVVARELNNSWYTGSISSAGLEGYTFLREGNTVIVFWGTSGAVTRDVTLACARLVTRTNVPTQVRDNDPSDLNPANGVIGVSAAANEPVFVVACP